MFRRFAMFMGVMGGMVAIAGFCHAVQVDGYCYLENQTNHEGTKVLFEADSPGAVTDSTFTDTSGYYSTDIAVGIYDIFYSCIGFGTESLLDQLIIEITTFPDIILPDVPDGIYISGSLDGVLVDTTYLVEGEIFVDHGDSLIIEAGAVLSFMSDSLSAINFNIFGVLLSNGTETDSIVYMPYPGTPAWGGFHFDYSADGSSSLSYSIVSMSNSSGIYFEGGLNNLTISNCTIRDNSAGGGFEWGGGVYCNSSGLTLNNCIFVDNDALYGGGLFADGGSADLNVNTCKFIDNYADYGGGIYCYYCEPLIDYCIFTSNEATGGGAIYCNEPTITNCTLTGNTASYGSGIVCYSSIIKNIIVEGNIGDGGIYFESSVSASVTYCDFYNNNGGNFSGDIPSYLGQIITTNANGDSCDAFFNIFEDPLFVDPNIGDFHLQADSPCIDAGDPTSPLDPDSTIADMGAFYFDQENEPLMAVWPILLLYGDVVVGEQADLTFGIYNVGEVNLIVGEPVSTNPEVFFTDFDPADTLIVPGDSLVLTASFVPAEIISYEETMMVWGPYVDPGTVTMRGTGINPVQVNITPYGAPIIIPETGGSIDFNISMRNLTGESLTFDLWTQIDLPGIGTVEPMTVIDITLSGGAAIDRDRTQEVPAFAPAGTYTYYACVGDYPWVVEDFSLFTFEKEGGEGAGSLGSPSDWPNTGQHFDEWIVGLAATLPSEYALYGAYPNPFNPSTTLNFTLPEVSYVNLAVYDVSGRLVETLVNGWRESGNHEITWDASQMPSGLYFCQIHVEKFNQTKKMVLVK